MVAALIPGSGLIRQLDWQDVDSTLSRVRPVSCPVDPMRRYVRAARAFASGDREVSHRLQELQWLLEWGYGYRRPKDQRQRFTRRAPSAGALYPTETLVVIDTEQGWQVLYYHYASHQFYRVPVADPQALARGLGLDRSSQAILFVAVLWRTVQRYGARGYRYCLLDAAHVASNLAHTARALQHEVELVPGALTPDLEDLLELNYGEALVVALRCGTGPAAGPVPVPPDIAELPYGPAQTTEEPPSFSPILRRVIAFHRRTLAESGDLSAVAWPGANDALDDLYHWAGERYSARDFTGEPVAAEQYTRMARVAASAHTVLGRHAPAIQAYAITARVEGMPVGSGAVGAEGPSGWTISPGTPAQLARQLSEACQNQSIMKPCAYALVLAARKSDLAAAGHIGYRHLILNAGFLCADLYREAARFSLGTTSIGGFSDDAISSMLGDPSLYPMVIQAFGVPARHAEKIDAARIVSLPQALLHQHTRNRKD